MGIDTVCYFISVGPYFKDCKLECNAKPRFLINFQQSAGDGKIGTKVTCKSTYLENGERKKDTVQSLNDRTFSNDR